MTEISRSNYAYEIHKKCKFIPVEYAELLTYIVGDFARLSVEEVCSIYDMDRYMTTIKSLFSSLKYDGIVLKMRFGLMKYSKHSYNDIAEALGMTNLGVSNLAKQNIEEIRCTYTKDLLSKEYADFRIMTGKAKIIELGFEVETYRKLKALNLRTIKCLMNMDKEARNKFTSIELDEIDNKLRMATAIVVLGNKHINELGLSSRSYNALTRNNITYASQFIRLREIDISSMKSVGVTLKAEMLNMQKKLLESTELLAG